MEVDPTVDDWCCKCAENQVDPEKYPAKCQAALRVGVGPEFPVDGFVEERVMPNMSFPVGGIGDHHDGPAQPAEPDAEPFGGGECLVDTFVKAA